MVRSLTVRAKLEPGRMTNAQLWARAEALVVRALPAFNYGPQDLEITLYQLQAVLNEIKLRGDQLALIPPAEGRREPEAS
jgi:hypothetical protein